MLSNQHKVISGLFPLQLAIKLTSPTCLGLPFQSSAAPGMQKGEQGPPEMKKLCDVLGFP